MRGRGRGRWGEVVVESCPLPGELFGGRGEDRKKGRGLGGEGVKQNVTLFLATRGTNVPVQRMLTEGACCYFLA